MNAANIRATLAHHPGLAQAMAAMGGAILSGGTVAPRQRELAILRMGWNCQARYEFGQHTLMARSVGVSDSEITAVTEPLSVFEWSPHDRAVLEMVDELYHHDCVSDHTWQTLSAWYDGPLMLELMSVALFYRVVSGLLNSCGVELDPGVPGWPTEANQ